MISDCEKIIKKQDVFNQHLKDFEVKVYNEIDFLNFLDEKDMKKL